MNRKLTRRDRRSSFRAAGTPTAEPLEGRLLFSTYTVTTLGDSTGSVTPTGGGTFNATTLRAALNAANAAAGADTVNFKAGLTGTITLGTALPAVGGPLALTGPGAANLTVRRSSTAVADFSILGVNAGVTATVAGLRLADGTGTRQANGDARGGAVRNAGTLTLTNCVLANNRAVGLGATGGGDGRHGWGGAIYSAGTLTLSGCALKDNLAGGGTGGAFGGPARGGAVFNSGTLTASGCTFADNRAEAGQGGHDSGTRGGDAWGGAIHTTGTSTNSVTTSSFTANAATGGPGGLLSPGTGPGGGAAGGAINNAGSFALADCTISGNSASASDNTTFGGVGAGGAVANAPGATLTVARCSLADNFAQFGIGAHAAAADPPTRGGALSNAGTATLSRSTLTGNLVIAGSPSYGGNGGDAAGGGASNAAGATLTLTDCTVSGNAIRGGVGGNDGYGGGGGGGGTASGGGVHNAGTLRVTGSTLSGNDAAGGQGGIGGFGGPGGPGGHAAGGGLRNLAGTARVVNSTVSGNRATGGNGGENFDTEPPAPSGGIGGESVGGVANGGDLRLTNVTVTRNSTGRGAGGNGNGGPDGEPGFGGSAGVHSVGPNTRLDNTIVAGNAASDADNDDVGGPFVSGPGGAGGHNLIGDALDLQGFTPTDQVGVDPLLGPLASNGGPTLTHALFPGSPAIDGGSTALADGPTGAPLTTDQRGAGFARVAGARADVGAFERPPSSTFTVNGTAGNDDVNVTRAGGTFVLTFNGQTYNADAAGVSAIVVNGLAGDDFIFVSTTVTIGATMNGGTGNDRLRGGAGPDTFNGGDGVDAADFSTHGAAVFVDLDGVRDDGPAPARHDDVRGDVEILIGGSGSDTLIGDSSDDVLVGNGGTDTLRGGGGRDLLIGGNGPDSIFGDAGDDLLVGGRTNYDANLPKLRVLSDLWRSTTRTYEQRASLLLAGAGGVRVHPSTVSNDSPAVDQLTGGADRDWFVYHAGDALLDKQSNETATKF